MTQSGHERAAFAALHGPDLLYLICDPWPSHETARVHHASRWRSGRSGSASGTRLRFYPARAERAGDPRSLPCSLPHSLGRDWHRRGVVVDDFPVVAVLHIGEAVAGRNRFGFAVLGVGERVITAVHRGVSVDADQLVTELDSRLRHPLEGADEVGFHGGGG